MSPAIDHSLNYGVAPLVGNGEMVEALLDAIRAGRLQAGAVTWRDEMALRRHCARVTAGLVAKIEGRVRRGDARIARREFAAFCLRLEVQLNALFRAARKELPTPAGAGSSEVEDLRCRRLALVLQHAGKIGRFTGRARATVFHKRKPNGRRRAITRFGLIDRARQLILKQGLTPFADLHPSQFMMSHEPERRGPAAVRKALLEMLRTSGPNDVLVQFDVRDFYGSIKHEWVERFLRLDPSLTQRHIHTGGMLFKTFGATVTVPAMEHEAKSKTGLCGLPQGSAVSPIVAEMAMADVLRSSAVFADHRFVVWSDNLAVIVPRDRVEEIADLVRAAFEQHDAGPFSLSGPTVSDTGGECQFIKMWFKPCPWDVVTAFIPAAVQATWVLSIGARLMTCADDDLPSIERHVAGKIANWSWYPPTHRIAEEVWRLVEARKGSAHRLGAIAA